MVTLLDVQHWICSDFSFKHVAPERCPQKVPHSMSQQWENVGSASATNIVTFRPRDLKLPKFSEARGTRMQSSRKVAETLKLRQLSECKGGAKTLPTQSPTLSERMRTDSTTLENFKSDSAPDSGTYLGRRPHTNASRLM